MNRLFIVSNRLPVNIQETEGDLQVHRSAGGLVAAISSYIQGQHIKGPRQFSEVYWAGVPGCTAATWTKAERKLAEQEYQYLPVFIRKRCYDAYYNGYANSLIWPLFHYFPSYADFDGDYFDDYMEANRCFLDALMLQVRPGDTIWIHDYHLMPLAGLIRQELPGVSIGFFLHIPFPSYEIFRMMPVKWQEAVIRGMMGADLIGFHTIDYATHFLKTVQMVLGLEDDMHVVRYMDRLVKVDVFPISIDYDQFHQAYQDKEVAAYRKSFSERFGNKKIIFSADRLDYTKGVFSRLKAYEHFLLQNPEYHGQVLFVLIVVPSRDHISRYAERKKMIDEYVGDINSRIGKINWQPVIYQYANLEFPELVAMYSSCHLALITPLRDGMNLVAKEFVACRQDRKGVLVLSELAGAVKELPDALLINPNDHADIALKIKQGLEMPAGEQSRRMQAMQQRVKLYNIRTWSEDFIGQLQSVKARQTAYEVKFLDTYGRIELRQRYQDAGKRLLLLDYDGTLVPFSALPTEAAPGRELLDVLTALTADNRQIRSLCN